MRTIIQGINAYHGDAAAGLLVLTTDISDVRAVLEDEGAVFMQRADPNLLNSLFSDLIANQEHAKEIAANGLRRKHELCDPRQAGLMVSRFIFGGMS